MHTLNNLPNGLRLSRLAGCALLGSVYNKRHRRRYAPYPWPKARSVPTAGWAELFTLLTFNKICAVIPIIPF